MRDTIGLIMLQQGVDISGAFTADQFGNAIDVLDKQLSSGQIRQVKGNSYKEDLISGDALAVIGWSGDITQLNARTATSGSSRSRTPAARCGATTCWCRSARRTWPTPRR